MKVLRIFSVLLLIVTFPFIILLALIVDRLKKYNWYKKTYYLITKLKIKYNGE